jgi:hypothetical protein
METFLFIIVLTWGCYQFLYRRFYKAQAKMYRKHIEKMKYKEDNERAVCGHFTMSIYHPERLN